MVIESKNLLWPEQYIHRHSLWHYFIDFMGERISHVFSDDIYVFNANEDELPMSRRLLNKTIEEITQEILKYSEEIKTGSSLVYGEEPFKWDFSKMPENDKLWEERDAGILFRSRIASKESSFTEKDFRTLSRKIQKVLRLSSKKFLNYEGCLRLIIIKPYSGLLDIGFDVFKEAIKSQAIPDLIDQIWLAEAVEIEDGLSEPYYHLIKHQ